MRARGVKITDIAVLVVAADEGIADQTVEALKHIQHARLPLVVAINKCDKAAANPEQIMLDLLKHGVAVEQHGGNVPAVKLSALKKEGLVELEEAILLLAELQD